MKSRFVDVVFVFFKQKTAYEMRISDWSSDVCSSDLAVMRHLAAAGCRHFFVATWAEAAALMPLPAGVSLSVLHGVGTEDLVAARTLPARAVRNSVEPDRKSVV